METISLKMNNNLLKDIDKILKKHRYSTRTEFIREAIRQKLTELEKKELLKAVAKVHGSIKRKTTDKQLHEAREQLAKEYEQKFK
jgi:metal-responsive CopG/Arc/MetJ family transcriptional regulator